MSEAGLCAVCQPVTQSVTQSVSQSHNAQRNEEMSNRLLSGTAGVEVLYWNALDPVLVNTYGRVGFVGGSAVVRRETGQSQQGLLTV